ncbi:hypothetical protein AWH56_012670 [Anaerobacillus isosaccharinicus]|uniref:Uncharacterized protein n=1 Tax=Anaerobacillus isosaccharinicus TaxID=1532552 RepID=A0A1S2M354_9BACI|nr:hypothetical protein [Anaerobacillus isosaccharinicus]MBA5588251.1 hypothetical protein [Anaerobacillus isosaccharinicus]QOY38306.1 hypothetical protein AWH56_012670 [Anaerobacillus isosaccharinicus]
MPAKTIYVRDEHLDIFNQIKEDAKKEPGDTTPFAFIVKMYEFYQQHKDFRNEPFEEKIFTILPHKKIRFFGCLLAQKNQYSVFLGEKGKFIVIMNLDDDLHSYQVQTTLSGLKETIPDDIYRGCVKALEGIEYIEFIEL